MGSGISGLYGGTHGAGGGSGSGGGFAGPVNGVDYNMAGSDSVQEVVSVMTSNSHGVTREGEPDSVLKNYHDGILRTERYFDEEGKPYLDIDYTDHGNPKEHPYVPHEHEISFGENGKMIRGKDKKI